MTEQAQPMQLPPHGSSVTGWRWPAAAASLLCFTLLCFINLGHYALWDDEANTALFAKGICMTGDTSATIGHNLVAYEGGWELKNLKERYIPPLPAYLTAASFALFGESSLTARIPFALCGVGSFVVVLWWLFREDADRWTWGLIIFALLTNVSLILYFRQARYYGIVVFLSLLLAYLYLHWSGTWQRQLLMVLLAIALFASNYISFGAAAVCLVIDWCIWGRKIVRLNSKQSIGALAILALATFVIISIYNPFSISKLAPAPPEENLLVRLWWNLKDLSVNEFCVIPLLALLPVVTFWKKDAWLARGGVVLLVYFLAIGIVEPHHTSLAQLRFMATTIPLCCLLEVRTLLLAVGKRKWIALLIGVPILGTNVLSGSTIFQVGFVPIPLRSTFVAYLGELADPPADPYRAASDWINANLPANSTICTFPAYASYPLMFHAPGQIYGWQLNDPAMPQFSRLPDIQFAGRVAPQYILIFGPEGMSQFHPIRLRDGTPVSYSPLKSLPVFGKDLFRPELYLRVFSTPRMDLHGKGIFILQKRADTIP